MTTRPSIVGPDSGPQSPYPYKMEGKVISGFGRGSKEVCPPSSPIKPFSSVKPTNNHQLGIPTANLPVDSSLTPWISSIPSGVYFGYASLRLPASHPQQASSDGSFTTFPMVMSIGYNPFYKNTVRSAEVHVLHKFTADFYDAHMRLLILGFIREEKDYKSLEALIEDINFDCEVARGSLGRETWKAERVGVEEGTGAEWLAKEL
ncbi:riboflavin kinase [Pochonia chlamydosporia 170]|uniref:Riboflavin kinase n=1 Tax=Pochonia chlamydosporia 170 TaxID=1380566 RepID=A0A179G7V5_METCM|nr:riboflavin kinase [Pochonia chlamydosporia 170]OAQ73875.1 riboflavin kinase [Pochonia chlamydosporia 170]